MSDDTNFFASCPKGIEGLLAQELAQLGATQIKETRAGVSFSTKNFANAYEICLWSRLANHIYLPLAEASVNNWDELSQFALQFDWSAHMSVENTFAIDVDLINSPFNNDKYAAQRFKDGLVDYWRERTGKRPTVKTIQPDFLFHVFVKKNALTLSLNLSGESLHRRGYRPETGRAPLKENLAAAILLRAHWPEIAAKGGSLFDPLCGSGSFLVEAAMIAGDIAPGLLRTYFGFLQWQEFKPAVWKKIREEAIARREKGLAKIPRIIGYDGDIHAIHLAQASIKRAGLESHIHTERRELANCEALTVPPGLAITNPPYGERLGEKSTLQFTYQHLGDIFKKYFSDWQCSVFTGNPDLAKALRLGPDSTYRFFNGTIPCQLLNFTIRERAPTTHATCAVTSPLAGEVDQAQPRRVRGINENNIPSGAEDFANRLRNNKEQREKIAKRENVSCYRVYDADLPDYAIAVDRYEEAIHVQEYAAPKTIDPEKAALRLSQALAHIQHIFNLPDNKIFLKTRQKQKGLAQYEKQANKAHYENVHENGLQFLVNLSDYLDTGLFLDSRWIRQWIAQQVKGKNFLNLFCYTGSATVYAASGKAASTVSVDMSVPYLAWAERNLAVNGFSPDKHQFIHADCIQWLTETTQKFDVILLDPPTFSNSKRMDQTLDIQRDQLDLVTLAMKHLTKDGTLMFVTNKQNFKLALEISAQFTVENITQQSLPFDFKRYPIHHAFLISHKQ